MKKFVSVVLSSLVVLAFVAGCATAPAASAAPAAAEAKPASTGKEVILLISAAGTLDDRAFNQGCYNGVKQFATELNRTYGYYQPTEDTVEAQVTMADTAIKGGAKFIIINSDQFKKSATIMVKNHPDVSFIIFDTIPVDDAGKQLDPLPSNILSILFQEQQSTFLAGYAAVKDGYTKLGFMGGMPVPAVVRFGYGFVAGIEAACKELGLQGKVEIKYNYSGNFKPTPENQARAASWFQSGTEIIHVAAGPMGASVFAAAEQNNGVVVGVDSDQSGESKTIITSAVKDLQRVTYNTLKAWADGKFVGGKVVTYGAKEGGVALVSMKWKNFTQAMYDDLYTRLGNDTGGLSSAIPTDKSYAEPDMIPLSCAKLVYVK
jgi:basic membrane protein A and related proteins